MKKLFCLAFLLFVGSFFGAEKAVAVVGNAAQLVDNERVMSEKDDVQKPKIRKKSWPKLPPMVEPMPGDRITVAAFWTTIIGMISTFFFAGYILFVFPVGSAIIWAFWLSILLLAIGFVFSRIGKRQVTHFRKIQILCAVMFWFVLGGLLSAIIVGNILTDE